MNHEVTINPPRALRPGGTLLAVAALLVLIAGGVLATIYFTSGGVVTKEPETASADIVPAEKGSFDILTLATGELEAKERIELRNRLDKSASIIWIIPEGSFVQAGDKLVELNSESIKDAIDEVEIQLNEAKIDLTNAESSLEIQKSENESKLRKAQLAVDLAKLALQQWIKEDQQKIEQLELDISLAELDVERLTDKYNRDLELIKRDFISRDQLKSDEAAKTRADATLERARRDLELYKDFIRVRERKQKESDVTEAEAELERVKAENEINLDARRSTVESRRERVEQRQQRLDELNQQFSYCTVVAPSPGLVVYGSTVQSDNFRMGNDGPLQVGRQVAPNELLIVLPDTSQMVAKVKVHESLAARVRPGQPAQVRIDAAGKKTFTGTVESVGVMAESGGWRDPNRREYSVRVMLDPGQDTDGLKPSMRCEASIQLGQVIDVVHVPVQAVFIDGSVTYVYTPRGGKFRRVPVRLGQRSDTRAEIVAGIDAGTPVLVRAPKPGEIIAEPWNEAELKLAGYALDENGLPVSTAWQGRSNGPRGGRPPIGAGGDAGPDAGGSGAAPRRTGDEAGRADQRRVPRSDLGGPSGRPAPKADSKP
ncbi:MAG: hypothetical protein Kow0022_17270 [Phycisphaerales bacterium]